MYSDVMGRPKTVNPDLPPRMGARPMKRGGFLYYYTGGGKKVPLGADLNAARMQWARLENNVVTATSYDAIADRWAKEGIAIGSKGRRRAVVTQQQFESALKNLRPAFKGMAFEEIRPVHIRQYLDRRSKKIAANREIAVLSIMFNWAREKGILDLPNPCLGVSRNQETPREKYVTDEEYVQTYDKAPPLVQDLMDLAYLTGQRLSDVLKMTRQDIREACLWVRQGKTGARVGIRLEGMLEVVVQRILARHRAVPSMFLIADDQGQRLNRFQAYNAFVAVRVGDWQFRDLRAKAASDAGNLKHAQRLLGHSSEVTTAGIYRRVKGNVVSPLK
jgi:integrase